MTIPCKKIQTFHAGSRSGGLDRRLRLCRDRSSADGHAQPLFARPLLCGAAQLSRWAAQCRTSSEAQCACWFRQSLRLKRRHLRGSSDVGACPFECCTFREWTVEADTQLHARPVVKSPVIASAKKGSKVLGITGTVVVTKPGEFQVRTPGVDGYAVGDSVWVYTQLGEGYFKTWHKGDWDRLEAAFMYEGATSCEDDHTCWGVRKSFPKSVWWVKVKNQRGLIGWTKDHLNFGNLDSCGG